MLKSMGSCKAAWRKLLQLRRLSTVGHMQLPMNSEWSQKSFKFISNAGWKRWKTRLHLPINTSPKADNTLYSDYPFDFPKPGAALDNCCTFIEHNTIYFVSKNKGMNRGISCPFMWWGGGRGAVSRRVFVDKGGFQILISPPPADPNKYQARVMERRSLSSSIPPPHSRVSYPCWAHYYYYTRFI